MRFKKKFKPFETVLPMLYCILHRIRIFATILKYYYYLVHVVLSSILVWFKVYSLFSLRLKLRGKYASQLPLPSAGETNSESQRAAGGLSCACVQSLIRKLVK
jgi:hypothetical protein